VRNEIKSGWIKIFTDWVLVKEIIKFPISLTYAVGRSHLRTKKISKNEKAGLIIKKMNSKIKLTLIKLHWIFSSQLGLDPRILLRSLRGLPLYLRDWASFRKGYAGNMQLMPCLHDRYEEGGATKSEYFWQDLLVARAIHAANPIKHVDIGSRVDGFVAHIASFRECEVFDVRPISTIVPGVVFRQADLMNPASLPATAGGGYCDSLSCLHAIEHFGLGRYGDPVNPLGYQRGIANMAQLLQPGGTFYLSTPIGQERVEFNANWVFDPRSIVRCAEAAGMTLQKLIVITPANGPRETAIDAVSLTDLALPRYQLGLFTFTKTKR
jgi:SAM-dependent methyltransferase